MAKIHGDKYGVYIKAGGYIFRPIFPSGFSHAFPNGTVFQAGETVKANHLGGSSLGSVRKDGVKEKWFSHGSYLDSESSEFCSEDYFQPSYHNWSTVKPEPLT